MANNDTYITIRGWVGAKPTVYQNDHANEPVQNQISGSGKNLSTVFNVGVTPRNYSRKTNQYEDGETSWYSVRTFGRLAENVAACVHKGDPLLVRGKLSARSYQTKDGGIRVNQVIVADAIGIELSAGTANYSRSKGTKNIFVNENSFADEASETEERNNFAGFETSSDKQDNELEVSAEDLFISTQSAE